MVKNVNAGDAVDTGWIPGLEDPLEKEMETHSSILAWEIPRTEEPGGLQSMGFSRQKYWSALPFPPPGDLPNPGTELVSYVSCIGRWVLYH